MDWYKPDKKGDDDKPDAPPSKLEMKKVYKFAMRFIQSYLVSGHIPTVLTRCSRKFFTLCKMFSVKETQFVKENIITFRMNPDDVTDALRETVIERALNMPSGQMLMVIISNRNEREEFFVAKDAKGLYFLDMTGYVNRDLKWFLNLIGNSYALHNDRTTIVVTTFKMRSLYQILNNPAGNSYDSDNEEDNTPSSSSESSSGPSSGSMHIERLI